MGFPMNFAFLSQDDLAKLNSATKYPSIPTYHVLGERGRLTEMRSVKFEDPMHVTEKIDGTNARIILPAWGIHGGNPIIGSREELLHYVGDLIHNPSQGIVNTIRPYLYPTPDSVLGQDSSKIVVIYGEVYGGVTTRRKQYTRTNERGFRVFDVMTLDPAVLEWPVERIASWRDNGGQQFLDHLELSKMVPEAGLALVPYLPALPPPTSIVSTYEWLQDTISQSQAVLDEGAIGRPEGVVVRSADRSKIAKIRFEDYERTLRTANQGRNR